MTEADEVREHGSMAAPMQWTLVENPNDRSGMTDEEIQRFLDRPIEPMAPLTRDNAKEAQ